MAKHGFVTSHAVKAHQSPVSSQPAEHMSFQQLKLRQFCHIRGCNLLDRNFLPIRRSAEYQRFRAPAKTSPERPDCPPKMSQLPGRDGPGMGGYSLQPQESPFAATYVTTECQFCHIETPAPSHLAPL